MLEPVLSRVRALVGHILLSTQPGQGAWAMQIFVNEPKKPHTLELIQERPEHGP